MVLLDILHEHREYLKILPYVSNGIIIDTSVMKIFIDGFVATNFSGKEVPQFEKLISFFHKIKIISGGIRDEYHWDKFLITPHIFTEICTHLKNDFDGYHNHSEIIESVIPILKEIKEANIIDKNKILEYVDIRNPIIEIGDISIFLTLEDYRDNNKKIAVLGKDEKFLENYGDNSNQRIMVMDFDIVMSHMEQL